MKIRQKELVLPSLIFVNIGCKMCYHLTWRKWKMEPSQLFLRPLKVIKESSKRHESNHCYRMESYTSFNVEKPGGGRCKENGRRGKLARQGVRTAIV